jgi:hypothetical protein
MKNLTWQKYLILCTQTHTPTILRHWLWNMRHESMQVFAHENGLSLKVKTAKAR